MKSKLLKVVLWRIISVAVTFCVLAMATGDVKSATGITLFLHFFLTMCHLAFESLWDFKVSKDGREQT